MSGSSCPAQVLIGGRAGGQFGVDRGQVRDDAAPDRAGQPLPRLVLDAEQSPSGRRQLRRLGLALLDPCGQLRLQQCVAERDTGLRCDVLEQVPLEGSQRPAGRHGDLDAADLLTHVQHREYQRRQPRPGVDPDAEPVSDQAALRSCAGSPGSPSRTVMPAAPTARPVASATLAGNASGDGLSASRRLSVASASYGAARFP